MERNQITGKLIAVSEVEKVASSQPGQTIAKRKVFMDCTRHDQYTGERGYENTPLLEFTSKAFDRLEELVKNGLKPGDIITVYFDIQGSKYTNKSGKTDIFTRVKPYDIEIRRQAQVNDATPAAHVQTAPVPEPAPAHVKPQESDLPF